MAKYRFLNRNLMFIILASVFMFLVGINISDIISDLYKRFFSVSILTLFVYMIVNLISRNEYAKELIESLARIVGKRK